MLKRTTFMQAVQTACMGSPRVNCSCQPMLMGERLTAGSKLGRMQVRSGQGTCTCSEPPFMLSKAVWTACMASTQVTAAECSCLPMLVLGRFDCRENAGQNAAREMHAGDLQVVSASIWCSAGGQ